MARKSDSSLFDWEVRIIKALIAQDEPAQKIHSYFTRPSRSINQARISQIRSGKIFKSTASASDVELKAFLDAWPFIDHTNGLHLQDDELLLKAREAMIAAVHVFNSSGINFRAEIFIVNTIIAWTYLLHAYYKANNIDYRHKNKEGKVAMTSNKAEKYWELEQCLKEKSDFLDPSIVKNLRYILDIRHEIEHRSTSRIDDDLIPSLQACCINFNDILKKLFGERHSLEKRLSIALQFSSFDTAQGKTLMKANLPPNLVATMTNFDESLSEAEKKDSKIRYVVAFAPFVANNPKKVDQVIMLASQGSPDANSAEKVFLKETERKKYTPTQIVEEVKQLGHSWFNVKAHAELWRLLKAKNKGKGYGVVVAGKHWCWYETWLQEVLDRLNKGWKPAKKAKTKTP